MINIIRPSSRVSGKFESPTSNQLTARQTPTSPRRLRDYAHSLSIGVSSYLPSTNMHVIWLPYAGIATAAGVAGGDWKLAMTLENIKAIIGECEGGARQVVGLRGRAWEVEGNGGDSLRFFWCTFVPMYPRRSRYFCFTVRIFW